MLKHFVRHWQTSVCGLACFCMAYPLIYENIENHAYNFGRLWETMHYWGLPLGLVALGIGLLFAADGRHVPPK